MLLKLDFISHMQTLISDTVFRFCLAGKITLPDLRNCKMAHVFFDTMFNLDRWLEFEQRDPFQGVRVRKMDVFLVSPRYWLMSFMRSLVTRSLLQGYNINRLSNTFKKFYGRYTDLVGQYKKNVCQMFADCTS